MLSVAGKVVDAVNSGAVKHFFLVGGCDGARPGRNYYTDFVKLTPKDTVVLTLACGKYRFNDLDLGTVGAFPRLMDIGQCNDAYSAIKIAAALAEAFDCGVNDLPLSMVLSWYEQKAVCILLTLLYLGIKNIRLGPTLPAFVSPNVFNYLVENFNIFLSQPLKGSKGHAQCVNVKKSIRGARPDIIRPGAVYFACLRFLRVNFVPRYKTQTLQSAVLGLSEKYILTAEVWKKFSS